MNVNYVTIYHVIKKNMNDFSLNDKVIIVTGGTGILGNAFVDAIVEAGGAVGILGRKKEPGKMIPSSLCSMQQHQWSKKTSLPSTQIPPAM